MADIYCSPSGSDLGAGTSGDPYETVGKAYSVATNGQSIELLGSGGSFDTYPATYDLVNEATSYLLLNRSGIGVTIQGATGTRSDVILQGDSTQTTHCVYIRDCGKIFFKDLAIQTAVTQHSFYCVADSAGNYGADVDIENCEIINSGTVADNEAVNCEGFTNSLKRIVQIRNSSVKNTGDGIGIKLAAVWFTANNITCEAVSQPCLKADQYVNSAGILDSTFTQKSDSSICVQFGKDSVTNNLPLGVVNFQGNTITYTSSQGNHGLLLGKGADNAECSYNTITLPEFDTSANIGIVVKGDGNNIHHNTVIAERCIYIKASNQNRILNNTCVANGTYGDSCGLTWGNVLDAATTYEANDNIIFNNIFEGSSGIYAVLIADTGVTSPEAGTNNNYCDYNNYTSGTDLLRNRNSSTSYTTLTALQGFWADSSYYGINDQNSLNVDPQLNANYQPQNSLVKNGGRPDINDDSTSMGAIGATAGGKGRYSGGGRYS